MHTSAIAQAKLKTDKTDAEVLANVLRCDYLPEVWEPDGVAKQRGAFRRACGRPWRPTAPG